MTDRLERRLPEVLTELAIPRMPVYIDDLLSRTERMPQRPGWTFLERWLPVGTLTSALPVGRRPILQPLLLLALVAALIVASVAFYFGTQRRLPPLFGPARNGIVVTANEQGDIVSVDPATQETRVLVAGPNVCCVDVSPDGQRFAFLRTDGTPAQEPAGLGVANVDGSNLRDLDAELATFIESLDWSPAGDRILIANEAGTVIVDVATGRQTPIETPFRVVRASWIGTTGDVLLSQRIDEAVESPASINVYRLAAGATTGAVEVAKLQHAVDYPLVSPDGSKFLYFIWGPEERTQGRIHVFDFATREDRAITPEVDVDRADRHSWQHVVWSPDGSVIAAELFAETDNRVAILPATGGTPVLLGPAFPTFTNTAIQFSPDGKSLLVTYRYSEETWLLPVDGSPGQKVDWAVREEIDWQRLAP